MSKPYSDSFAEHYDLIYQDKDYAGEVAFLNERIKPNTDSKSSLIDLTCGTGHHIEHFAGCGWSGLGLDLSSFMIERAKTRKLESFRFEEADMRLVHERADLKEQFDVCVSLFDSLGYAVSNHSVIDALRSARHVLRSCGTFAFEVWHSVPMLRGYTPLGKKTFPLPDGGELIRLSEVSLNAPEMSARVHFTFIKIDPKGHVGISEETHLNRFFGVPELRLLLKEAGWAEEPEFYDGYSNGAVTDSTWHIVSIIQKSDG